jgi:hypothetical protein
MGSAASGEPEVTSAVAQAAGFLRLPWSERRKAAPPSLEHPLGARIIFGRDEPSTFSSLSHSSQPYPFIVGPDDVHKFFKAESPMDMLELIGFERDWVQSRVDAGSVFRMLLFSSESFADGGGFISPTWDHLLAITERENKNAGKKLKRHLDTLKSLSYADLCAKIGFDVEVASEEQINYKDVCSFDAYGDKRCPDDLAHARAFLRRTLMATPLFKGDGFTYNERGERGVAEFLVKRCSVSSLPGHEWVDLHFV